MKNIAVVFFGFFAFRVGAQEVHFTFQEWMDPRIFEINQSRMHTPLLPYTDKVTALDRDTRMCPYYQSLNGTWKFNWSAVPEQAPGSFYEEMFDVATWDDIDVPSNWQMKGYGHPKFRNVSLTFPSDPPRVPDYYNPVGSYKRTFHVPGEWLQRQVFLHFEGVKSASYIWINGMAAGYNEGGMEAAEFDITRFVREGGNQIAVRVLRYSDGTYLENQDMWRLAGIYRDVYLFATPKTHMRDYYIVTDLDAAYKDAVLHLECEVSNYDTKKNNRHTLEVEILDASLNLVLPVSFKQSIKPIRAGGSYTTRISIPVSNPLKWSAEKPHLYWLRLSLHDAGGTLVETYAAPFGFKEVEVQGQALCVNGVPVKLNGVNSHMHHPLHGKSVPLETTIRDFELMKRFNINLVRTSHYPPAPDYLDLADQYGIYIVDETGDECHKNIFLSELPEWRAAFVDRAEKMVLHDRNHPSIIFWSAGNEAGNGENIRALMEAGKELDPSRPAWMYGGNTFMVPFEDIVGPRYWEPYKLRQLAMQDPNIDSRPSFMDEYLAATGNSLGAMDEYWDLIYRYPRLTGGAIWDWVSPAIEIPLRLVRDVSKSGVQCAMMGRSSIVDGPTGRALSLSGNDEWIEVYRHPALDIVGKEITLACDVRPGVFYDTNPFIAKGNYQYGLVQNHRDSLEFYIGCGERQMLKIAVPDDWYDEWHTVTANYDGRWMRLYIDGDLKGQKNYEGRISDYPFAVNIGRNAELHDDEHPGMIAHALMDNVQIYRHVLHPGQLQSLTRAERTSLAVLYLDFESVQSDGNFYSVGPEGRTYGLVWADRSVQPELWQVKKSAQPVKVEAIDLEQGVFRVINRYHFTALDEVDGVWTISRNGKILHRGSLDLDVLPGDTAIVQLPLSEGLTGPPAEDVWLDCSFRLKADQSWAAAGHEVAWDQFLIRKGSIVDNQTPAVDVPLRITEDRNMVHIVGGDVHYSFDKTTGTISNAAIGGSSRLQQGPVFNVWRAPLANDMDNWSSWTFKGSKRTPGLGHGRDNHWRTLGVDKLTLKCVDFQSQAHDDATCKVIVHQLASTPDRNTEFELKWTYLFAADGSVRVSITVIPHGTMPDWLPRVGIQVLLPGNCDQIQWYGRGPFENYPDRKTGARVGIYSSTAREEYVPYLTPQDYGNKSDVRWLIVTDEQGRGWRIAGDGSSLFNFSTHIYGSDNLERAMYPFQLVEADHMVLNLDHRVSGVGDTSKSTLQQYRVPPDVYTFSFVINPLSP